jgi:cytidylate kinase
MSMIRLQKKIIVAIDGYSSCGKSSFARLIARELDYIHLDSGAMYRAVTFYALQKGCISEKKINIPMLIANLSQIHVSFRNQRGNNYTYLNEEPVESAIRGVEVSSMVSEISKLPEVRKHLVKLQQQMGNDKGIVMEGRDIGTVVFPDAEIKIFMTADTSVRAKRRYDELRAKGMSVSIEEITRNITERDDLDIHREISPLVKADDAVVLDNSHMTFGGQMNWFRELLIRRKLVQASEE